MKLFFLILSFAGFVITSFFLTRSLGGLHTFNDYIFAAVQVVLISIWIIGIIMHKDALKGIIRKLKHPHRRIRR